MVRPKQNLKNRRKSGNKEEYLHLKKSLAKNQMKSQSKQMQAREIEMKRYNLSM